MPRRRVLPLYRQVAQSIQADIRSGRLAPGDRLPSIREISKQFRVAGGTVQQAIRHLGHRGLVTAIQGSGLYVSSAGAAANSTAANRRTVSVVKVGVDQHGDASLALDSLMSHLNERDGTTAVYRVLRADEVATSISAKILADKPDCIVLHRGRLSPQQEEALAADLRGMAVPLLMFDSTCGDHSRVTFDIPQSVGLLATYLYDIGHRSICLLTSGGGKAMGLQQAAARWPDASAHAHVIRSKTPDEDPVSLASRALALKPQPTAIIVSHYFAALFLIGYLRDQGFAIPDDISVATIGSETRFAETAPFPITEVGYPAREIVRETLKWIDAACTSVRKHRRIAREILGTLIARDSTSPPRSRD